jgi:hypothetical protein
MFILAGIAPRADGFYLVQSFIIARQIVTRLAAAG